MTPSLPSQSTQHRIELLMSSLDYEELADIYCEKGGREFWSEKRQEVLDLGRLWVQALTRRLPGPGRSLYAGAGVAELPAILTELLDLGREVVISSLRERECRSLNRSLESVGLGDDLQYLNRDAASLSDCGPFDHLCAVSLLDDPESFPTVSAVTYGDLHPVHLDPDAFAAEGRRVRSLVDGLWVGLRKPFLITTTAEEVPWFLERANREGARVEADEELIPTAIVGDPVGFLVIRAE